MCNTIAIIFSFIVAVSSSHVSVLPSTPVAYTGLSAYPYAFPYSVHSVPAAYSALPTVSSTPLIRSAISPASLVRTAVPAAPVVRAAVPAPAAPIVRTALPAPLATAPVAPVLAAKIDYADAYPQYQYAYNIQDTLTGDSKAQEEIRDGGVVKGRYSLIEADGSRRTVSYYADPLNGFNAIVQKDIPVVAPVAPVKAAPTIVSV